MKARSLFLFLYLGITFLAVGRNNLSEAMAAAQQGTTATAEEVAPSWTPPAHGPCAEANMTLQPILLAPSWDAVDTIDQDTGGFKQMLPNLEGIGYRLDCNLFYASDTAANLTIYENGEVIRDTLCEAYQSVRSRSHSWDGHFDIIGHSFGGLRARAFLEDHRLYDQFGREGARCEQLNEGEELFVDNLFTLGSPHGGGTLDLPGALVIGLFHLGHLDSIIELLYAMPTFNETFSQAPNVCYWLVGGDAWQQEVVSDRFSLIHTRRQETTPNDLGVYRWSAQEIADRDKYGDKYPNAVRVDTDDMHGYHWLLSDIQSYVFPDSTFNVIKERIGGSMADCEAAQGTNSYASFAGNEPPTPPVPSRLLAAGELANGTVITGDFQMDEGGAATLYLNWPTGDVDLTLTDPSGNLIGPTTAQSDANVDYLEATIMANVASYALAYAAPGAWNYTITALDVPFTVPYKLVVLPGRPIAVVAQATEWQRLGWPVTISATVSYDETTLLAGATVQASVSRPDGGIETLTLFDDGSHEDGAAGDGIYGNDYTAAGTAGYYLVTITASGTYQAQAYTRTAQATFAVASNAALLTDRYNDQPHDANSDGFYEWLEVGADIAVNQAGDYTLAADLVAQDGRLVSHAVAQAALSAGTRQMTLAFNGQDIADSSQDGPYILTNVLLVDRKKGTLLLDRAEDVYETAAYDYAQFGKPPAIYLPIILRH